MTYIVNYMNATKAKQNISAVVAKYKFAYPDDYALVVKAVEAMHHVVVDDFASMEGSKNMRGLFETPEDLYTMFITDLEVEEMQWFKSTEGGRWYAKKFKEFALPKSIDWKKTLR
jgi:hypothetical protein